jgi:hypothetical protein
MSLPRGIRLNNTGNLEKTAAGKVPWQGEVIPSRDPRFATFVDLPHGIRAHGDLIHTYERLHGLLTVAQKVLRWAPPTDPGNDTTAYIAAMAKALKVSPTAEFLTVDNLANTEAWLLAQTKIEQAGYTIAAEDLHAGMDLLFGPPHSDTH